MQTYKAVVFARNNVAEARNGPSVEVEGIFHLMCLFHLICQRYVNFNYCGFYRDIRTIK